jgi:hypothetical protein
MGIKNQEFCAVFRLEENFFIKGHRKINTQIAVSFLQGLIVFCWKNNILVSSFSVHFSEITHIHLFQRFIFRSRKGLFAFF